MASRLVPLVRQVLGADPPFAIRGWDGSRIGPADAPATIALRSPDALRRVLYAPDLLGLARAYVSGDADIEGDLYSVLRAGEQTSSGQGRTRLQLGGAGILTLLRTARQLGALGAPLPPPPEEVRLRGRRHSRRRDSDAITHHYDLSNDFYRLFLGETMTYSCAYFERPGLSLDAAQRAKYELICRKLGLQEGMRLLDVGCGWGGMVLHAAQAHGVRAVGVTISPKQAELARQRVAEAGLAHRIEIRLQDYRDVADGPYDAISSIGMFEHVGLARLAEYFATLFRLLPPGGRLLNHGISKRPGASGIDERSFLPRYVFPDGEVHEVGTVITAMERQGFEVRDVESLREHYAITLRRWVANLEATTDAAQALVGPARYRIWRLYMAACALGFEAGNQSIHQSLAVRPAPTGESGIPMTRADLLLSRQS